MNKSFLALSLVASLGASVAFGDDSNEARLLLQNAEDEDWNRGVNRIEANREAPQILFNLSSGDSSDSGDSNNSSDSGDSGVGKALAEHFAKNYTYTAQVGAQYTQGYPFAGKNNYQSLFAYLGFEGLEFEHLRFGLDLMGSVKLGDSRAVYSEKFGANALLYQAFVGFTSDYFDISVGREELDLEWVNDYVEGARFSVKLPEASTNINAFWFQRQAVADINEIGTFEDGKVGHTIIAGITNNIFEPLTLEAYFLNQNAPKNRDAEASNGANGFWIGANLAFGGEEDFFTSNTKFNYTYLHGKGAGEGVKSTLNYVHIDENLGFNIAEDHSLSALIGFLAVINKTDADLPSINELGDQSPLKEGKVDYDQVYSAQAKTFYIGLEYGFSEYFGAKLVYGVTSGIKEDSASPRLKPIHQVNLVLSGAYEGLEAGILYSKVLSKENFYNDSKDKTNRDYFEAFLAYSF